MTHPLQGYNHYAKFIATQHPLLSREEEFWNMIIENKSAVIVMFSEANEKYKVS